MRWFIKVILKVLFYAFIVFHLIAVVLVPNESAIQTRAVQSWILPYLNTLGLNTHWRFFSPGPMPALYMKYQLNKEELKEDSTQSVDMYEERTFPKRKNGLFYSSSYIRRLYTLRHHGFDRARIENFFAPYFCRIHPGSETIHFEVFTYKIPRIESLDREIIYEDLEKKIIHQLNFQCDFSLSHGNEDSDETQYRFLEDSDFKGEREK